jgi:alkanesulfonate monooxygenase SsuD/methylene tetrahydromethanopterin reductase-like flavin-dependent oxidoreductase (luciferase family)
MADTSFEPSMEHSIEVCKKADEYGFELLVPVGRWKGFGGQTDFNGQSQESYTWASAVSQHTDYTGVVATSHVPTVHPMMAAKQSTTVDHASKGRFVLNVVSGWFTPEIELFGAEQLEHDERYTRTHEWMEFVKKLWTEQGFKFEGEHYQLTPNEELEEKMRGPHFQEGGYMRPKPFQTPHPPVMNAGTSDAGRDFAAKHADASFFALGTLEDGKETVQDIKERAEDYGRDPDDIEIMSYGLCCIGDTEEEAQEEYDRIVEEGDWEGNRNIMEVLGIESGSFDDQISEMEERFIAGWGGYPLVGTPQQIADELQEISEIGISGMILSFLDFLEGTEEFGEKVLPLMEERGTRVERRGERID